MPFCILALKDGGVGTLAVLVTGLFQVVVLIRTNTSSILTQFVSWRRLLSIDFREVQRANGRLGAGSIVSGLVGSLPLSSSAVGVRFINQTKCASRRVGALVAAVFLVVAVVPKAWVAVVAVPRALVVVNFLFIVVPLFATVVKSQKQSFRQARNIVLIGLPVLVGAVIETGLVDFPDSTFWDAVTKHGLPAGKRLRVTATARGSTVEVEFASGPTGAENLEDRIALLADPESDMSELEIERDVSLRLLRHYATTVNHRQYNEAEIITAVVTCGGVPPGGSWWRLWCFVPFGGVLRRGRQLGGWCFSRGGVLVGGRITGVWFRVAGRLVS